MTIVLAVVVPALVLGALTYAAARRWPRAIEAPRIEAATVAEEGRRHPALGGALRQRTDPTELPGLALTVAVAAMVVATAGIGLLLVMVRTNRGLARWDLSFARFGAEHATTASTHFLRTMSLLGG